MRKKLLFFSLTLAGFLFGIRAQTVTTPADFINALKNGSGNVVITIPENTTIDITNQTMAPGTDVTGLTVQGSGKSSVLYTKGTCALTTDLSVLAFRKLTISRAQDLSKSNYALDLLKASTANIGSVIFDRCTIDNFKFIIRMKEYTATKGIESLSVNGCLITRLASVNLIGTEGSIGSGSVNRVVFKNNVVTDNAVAGPVINVKAPYYVTDAKILNNTFYNPGTTSQRMLMSFTPQGVTPSYEFRDNLLGDVVNQDLFNYGSGVTAEGISSGNVSVSQNLPAYGITSVEEGIVLFPNGASADFTPAAGIMGGAPCWARALKYSGDLNWAELEDALNGNQPDMDLAQANIVLTDKTSHFFPVPVLNAGAVSYTRNFVEAGKWGTLVLPFAAVIPEGCTVQKFSLINGTTVLFSTVTVSSLEPGVPYIIKSTSQGDKIFTAIGQTIVAGASPDYSTPFTGTYRNITEGSATGKYVFNGSTFARANERATVPAFRAFFDIPASTVASFSIGIGGDGGATGIEKSVSSVNMKIFPLDKAIAIELEAAQVVTVHCIDGRTVYAGVMDAGNHTVSGLAPGLYMVNNFKVAVK